MKKPTIGHLKFEMLSSELELPKWQVIGVLESLWLFAQYHAVDGNLSDFTPKQVAAWFGWKGDAGKLIEALVNAGWLDRSGSGDLTIHDWSDHAPNWVKGALKSTLGKPSENPNAKRSAKGNAERSARAYAAKERKGKALNKKELYNAAFETFWAAYPVRVTEGGARTRGNKEKAAERFQALNEAEIAKVTIACRRYAASKQRPRDAVRWLNDSDWKTWLEDETAPQATFNDDDLDGLETEDIGPRK